MPLGHAHISSALVEGGLKGLEQHVVARGLTPADAPYTPLESEKKKGSSVGFRFTKPNPFLYSEVRKMSSKKNKIRPLQDRIIVERLAPEEKSMGGIILPDSAQERPQRGRVVAVGKGKVREDGSVVPVDVKEGDEILFGKYSGVEVKVEGSELLIMREDDVLGVVL